MNYKILIALIAFFGLFAAFASAGCMISMVAGDEKSISVDINWDTPLGTSYGSMAQGYVVPVFSTMIGKINGTYTVHCENGDNDSHIPPHRAVITNLDTGSAKIAYFDTSYGSHGHWCTYGCPAYACNGQLVADGVNPSEVYDFNEEGNYHVVIQWVKWAIEPSALSIPEDQWVTDANFNVLVFSPLLVIYGSRITLLPLEQGRTTSAQIVWTIQNLSGIDMRITDINSPECAKNGLKCGWKVNPAGLKIDSKKFIVLTQDINLENPDALYLPRDINFYLDVNYTDANQGVMRFQKRSEPTLLQIKPVAEKKFSIKVKGQEAYSCTGIENGQPKTGYYGTAAVPRVRFNWDWASTSRIECDTNSDPSGYYHYCDAAQFSMELLKRLERIDKINTGDILGEPSSNPAQELSSLKNFAAYLSKDGYSQDLINDLIFHLRTRVFVQTNNWFDGDGNFFKFFADSSHFKILLISSRDHFDEAVQLNLPGAAEPVLEGPGLYEVLIKIPDTYDDNSLRKFILNGNINTDINIYLLKKTSPAPDSIFYYLPIDGKVGFVESASGGIYERQGYGSSYTGPGSDKNLLIVSEGNPPTVGGNAENSVLAIDVTDTGDNFNDFSMMNQQERGGILRVSTTNAPKSYSITRYLSNATPVLMRINQGNVQNSAVQPSNNADAFYYIKKNETTGNVGGIQVSGSNGKMAYWNGIASNMVGGILCMDFNTTLLSANFYSKPDANLQNYPGSNCNPPSSIGRSGIFGFSWANLTQVSDKNFVYAQTVFYTLKDSIYKIHPGCDNKDNLIYAMPELKISRNGNTEIRLNYAPKYDATNSVDVESLVGVFEGVSKGYICLKADGNAMADFWWNEQKLYNQLDAMAGLDANFTNSFQFCKTPA